MSSKYRKNQRTFAQLSSKQTFITYKNVCAFLRYRNFCVGVFFLVHPVIHYTNSTKAQILTTCLVQNAHISEVTDQCRSDGGISVYIPPKISLP